MSGPREGTRRRYVRPRASGPAIVARRRPAGASHGAAKVQRADLRMLENLTAAARQAYPPVLQDDAVRGKPQAGPRVLLYEQDRLALGVHQAGRVEHGPEYLRPQAHGRLIQ